MYSIIIKLFTDHYPQYLNNKYKALLSRSILKTIIMVVNYNAGENRCLQYLQEKLRQEHISINEINLKEFNNHLYEFLTTKLFDYFFLTNKIEFLKQIGNFLELSDAHINLAYLNLEEKQEVVKIADLR